MAEAAVKMVNVKLAARCLVNNQIREAGEVVDLPETADDGGPFAACFGEIVKPAALQPPPGPPTSKGGE